MNAMKRHTLAILAAVLAACIIIVGMTCPAALAAEQLLRANGKHYNYFLDGKPYVIGVNAESRSGKFYYCRQIESMTDYKVTETTTVENTEAARRLAWLLSEYQHDGNRCSRMRRSACWCTATMTTKRCGSGMSNTSSR